MKGHCMQVVPSAQRLVFDYVVNEEQGELMPWPRSPSSRAKGTGQLHEDDVVLKVLPMQVGMCPQGMPTRGTPL